MSWKCFRNSMLVLFLTLSLVWSFDLQRAHIKLRWSSLTAYEKYVSHLLYKRTGIAVR